MLAPEAGEYGKNCCEKPFCKNICSFVGIPVAFMKDRFPICCLEGVGGPETLTVYLAIILAVLIMLY
jgi:hypothetical protein